MANKTATVSASDVVATLTGYVAYVDLSRLGITTLAEAESVRVYGDSSHTTEQARFILNVSTMHVYIPSLTTSTSLFVDYDGIRSNYADTATFGRNAVWTDYSVVYPLNSLEDVTGNGNTLTANGGVTTGGDATSPFGYGTAYDGLNDYHNVANSTDFDILSGAYTMQSWIKTAAASSADPIMAQYAATSPRWSARLRDASTPSLYTRGTTVVRSVRTTTSLTTDLWTKVDITGNASDVSDNKYYINAIDSTTSSGLQNGPQASSHDFEIAAVTFTSNFSEIAIAEVRLRKSVLSQAWLTTEHNNQNDEAGFWGTWTDYTPGGGGPTPAKNPLFFGGGL